MSTSEATSSSSSRRQNAEPPPPPQRDWVALVSAPVILADGDERARAMVHGAYFELDLHDPPRPSYLVLHPRVVALAPGDHVARQPSAYILAADPSGRLLFRVSNPGSDDPDKRDVMYLCHAHVPGRLGIISLPAVPYARLDAEPRPRRSIGLVADPDPDPDPDRPGRYLVAQLYPIELSGSGFHDASLLCFSTTTSQWSMMELRLSLPAILRNPCAESETAVIAHAGRLYWIALACGVFVCDPFAAPAQLGFVPLPPGCEILLKNYRINVWNLARRRRVALSEDQLRYVEVRGFTYEVYVPPNVEPPPVNPSVWMWTLVDPEAPEPWRREYEVPFAEVWADKSYVDAGLPQKELPVVAFVDPDDHGVVYFRQGTKLYGLDVPARRVLSCVECSVRDSREFMLRNSRPIIDAWAAGPWELPAPPAPPRTEPSSPSPRDESDNVESLLATMKLTTETD